MAKRKYVVLPIEGNSGKYIVVRLEDDSLVLIAQPRKIFETHTDIFLAFERAQKKSPEKVLKQYEEYEKLGMDYGGIKNRKNLVRALEQFSQMRPMTSKNSLEGGGRYHLSKRVLTLHDISDTYGPVDREVLDHFITPLREYYAQSGKPLEDIVIK